MVAILLAWTLGCKKNNDKELAEAQLIEANKAAAEMEWQTFKAEQEAKIAANELIVADYKAKMTNSKGKLLAAYDKKVEELELKNKELKTKLDNYTDEGKDSWEKFKSEFNRDISELGEALKNFGVDNKK
jgi:chaperonin cofactor prefoldin